MFRPYNVTDDQFFYFHAATLQSYNVFDVLDEMMNAKTASRLESDIINIADISTRTAIDIVSLPSVAQFRTMAVCVHTINELYRLTTILTVHEQGYIDENLIEFSYDPSVSDNDADRMVAVLFGDDVEEDKA
jgi:hypothetical protein